MAEILAGSAKSLEDGGADFVILCTNTMHKVAGEIEASIHIPFLHIADATGQKIQDSGIGKVGLLGTRFTMEEDFYKRRLAGRYGLEVTVPDARQREIVHRVISMSWSREKCDENRESSLSKSSKDWPEMGRRCDSGLYGNRNAGSRARLPGTGV